MQPELMTYWSKLLENFQFSPLEFYDIVQKAIEQRQVPSLKVERVEIKESGILSANRTYLRLSRERFYFDICGAPFGSGFFVSSRLLYNMARVTVFHIIALVIFVFMAMFFSVNYFGMYQGILLLLLGILGVIGLMFLGKDNADLKEVLLVIPVLGVIFERVFCPLTYYKIDLIMMYQEAVHESVMEAMAQIMESKGLKPMSELERKPVLHQLLTR